MKRTQDITPLTTQEWLDANIGDLLCVQCGTARITHGVMTRADMVCANCALSQKNTTTGTLVLTEDILQHWRDTIALESRWGFSEEDRRPIAHRLDNDVFVILMKPYCLVEGHSVRWRIMQKSGVTVIIDEIEETDEPDEPDAEGSLEEALEAIDVWPEFVLG